MQQSRRGRQEPASKDARNTSVKPHELGVSALKSRLDQRDGASSSSSGTTGWKSAGGDVSYRDAVLPPAQKRVSREQLDKQLIIDAPKSQSQYLRKISNDGFTALARSCLRVITDNIGEKVVQDSLLTRIVPFRCAENLCRRVKNRFAGREMPFSVWQLLLSMDANAMPASMKTYTGLVLDDIDELSNVNTLQDTTLLDLSDTAFQKADIYKIRLSFSNSLAALRLDHLAQLDDDTITALSRDAGAVQSKVFAKLEVLTLQGCKLITDKSAPKLARFTALKLLDLRATSCTTATKDILRRLTKPPYISAFTPIHLSLFGPLPLDETYRQMNRAVNTPLVKNTEDLSDAAALFEDPCILVTALSRLDSTKVLDPRDPVIKNRFVASHHIYGNVYTTVPISKESLGNDGSAEASRGAAFRYGSHMNVMGGQLHMSGTDVGWRRFAKKGQLTGMASPDVLEDENLGDSDLETSETETYTYTSRHSLDNSYKDDPSLSAFYPKSGTTTSKLDKDLRPAAPPERNPLMLLRFIKTSSMNIHSPLPAHAELVRPDIRTSNVPDDYAAIRVKKRPRIGKVESIDALKRDETYVAKARGSSHATVTPSPSSDPPTSTRGNHGPTSILRKADVPSKLAFTNILAKMV